jgi:hypothetical protein
MQALVQALELAQEQILELAKEEALVLGMLASLLEFSDTLPQTYLKGIRLDVQETLKVSLERHQEVYQGLLEIELGHR